MNTSARLLDVLQSLLTQLPSVLAILGCMVAAIIRWRRHPRVSLTVLISLLLLLAITFAFAFIYAFVPYLLRKPGDDFNSMRSTIAVITFLYNSLWALALAVLLAAIFMKRNEPVSRA